MTLELDALAESLTSWLTTANQLTDLALRVAPPQQKPAVEATAALLRQVRQSIPAWKGPTHGH